jgi:hypothetical protein
MLLKGTVLTLNYYEDYGLRSMGDFDLMVRLTDVVAAIAILKENGWKMRDGICDASMHGVLGQNILRYNHAEHFINDSRQNLDLHWHLLDLCLETNADDSFWDASIAGKFDSIDVRLLNPADQLLHVCVHGLMWSDVPGIRWIPDSLAIIRKVPTLDWNRLLIQAQDRDLRLFVRSALNYLVSRFSAPVPAEVMLAVNALPAEADEAREFAVFTGSRSFNSTKIEKEYSILKTLRVRFYIFKRIAASAKLSGIKIGVWGYLSAVCRMDNGWRTFVYILYRFAKMASRSVRRVIFDSFESLTTG